ncbi:MAG: hypothetical protein CMF77_02430 [Candidatus Marinimicrobia bacterium]|jgi:hypothetical protein|nr:hypothetical protein [Candidatus Neomarinimicrobiota bacterium]|tara:strand:+ start:99 stop:548 length:450 start_codon:yes stop_codon:yes gene_type:complete
MLFSSRESEVRLFIYQYFIDTAEAPPIRAITDELTMTKTEAEASLKTLESQHALVLKPDSFEIWMAHPFSAVPTSYPVKTDRLIYYANCAWDALGIPAMLEVDSETVTTCPDCEAPVIFGVQNRKLTSSEGVIHFSVPPRKFWDDVGFT